MTTRFHIVSGGWTQDPINCKSVSLVEANELQSVQPQLLKNLKPACLDYTEELLQKHLQKFDGDQNPDQGYWNMRTVVEAMCCPVIQDVSFIPANPHTSQILYVKREGENEDISKSAYYPFHIGNFRFILAVEIVNDVFTLTQVSLSETLPKLDMDDNPSLKRVLNCFQEDKTVLGIALTIIERCGLSKTYLWFKG